MQTAHQQHVDGRRRDVFDVPTRLRTVAIMGGHDVPRNNPIFKAIRHLALELHRPDD